MADFDAFLAEVYKDEKKPAPSTAVATPPLAQKPDIVDYFFGKSTTPTPPTKDTRPVSYPAIQSMQLPETHNQFWSRIAEKESRGKPDPYAATNKSSSASGKYQFLWGKWGDKISEFAGQPVTKEEFLRSPDLQEKWAAKYHDTVLVPEAEKLKSRYGKNLEARGISSDNQLKALIHFLGYTRAAQYAMTGKVPAKIQQQNMTVPEYLKGF